MDVRLLLAVLFLACSYCYELPDAKPSKILAFLPTETRSHFNGFKQLLQALVARGHDLTLVSPYPLDSTGEDGSILSYKHVRVETINNPTGVKHLNKNSLTNILPPYLYILWLGPFITRKALEKRVVKEFILHDRSSFDLVIVENFFHECFVVLGHKYGAPVVQLLPFNTNPRVSQWHGNPYDPSYLADITAPYAAPMTFWQRTENTVAALFNTLVNRLVYLPQQRKIMNEYFAYAGHEQRPDLETMLRNVSLTLINSHPLMSPVAPFVPSYVQVAGMHIKPAKSLPEDIKRVMDTAVHGVVYFSLGSVIKSSEMPRETVKLLLSKLANIKQTVLWKWEDDQLPDLPKNVIVRKWFPQNDILNHPNCRLFITHGGIHSVIESVYHGVPMLSIPVFGDQTHNSVEAAHRGFALYVPYFKLTAEEFDRKLQQILGDARFGEAARKASSIMKDNPISILDRAVFWIEYVLRHEGAPHLRTAATDLYWFQYYLLDVIAALSVAIGFVVYLNCKFVLYLLKKLCRATAVKSTAMNKSAIKKKKRQ
ncbi:UDP-glucuronosyl/UDP-glucosyltransferase [Cinara cedri]|uniref:UDP-glucuronosyl/UDP-glucosyltransferase n=1 Tax=Cinara cedri TaxID=506608 RepID=A0A5E4MV46_9HEMI|nr:UDP-glucuronosyl/UDP-glucosyltransferase [Cinara cedri]